MISWIIVVVAFLLSILWGVMFLRQLQKGLAVTALDDKFSWGLYIQGFFYFSALAGGILVFVSVATLFELEGLRPLVHISAAVSFSCLVVAGLLLGSDLGKPFRTMKMLTGKNFASPLTWDFFMISLCTFLNLVFLLGFIPARGPAALIWAILCLLAALGYVMIHTLFFLSRVGAGFRSQPFLGLDTLAQSLWGGLALVTLIAVGSGRPPFDMVKLLIALTVLTMVPSAGSLIAVLSGTQRREGGQGKTLGMAAVILVILVAGQVISPGNRILAAGVSVLVLIAVFLEKSHLLREYQVKPTLPLPYSRYDAVPNYTPTLEEWLLSVGSVGICVLLSFAIHFLQSAVQV